LSILIKEDKDMTKEEFVKMVTEGVEDRLPECRVEVRDIPKNNGMMLTGLIIRNDKTNLAPTIYLEYYYERYKNGVDLSSICDAVIDKYREFSVDRNFDVNLFTNWEFVKEKICYKLINFKQNRQLLAEIPHLLYLDLAVVFYCPVEFPGDIEGFSTILITNSHLKNWGKKMEDLFEVASENTPRLMELKTRSLVNVVREQVLEAYLDISDEELEAICEANKDMTILSNKEGVFGASVILYKDALKNVAEKLNSSLVIIPSSVHEVLIMPLRPELDSEYMNGLIGMVNDTQLETDEVLSNHFYYYDKDDDYVFYDLTQEELRSKSYIA